MNRLLFSTALLFITCIKVTAQDIISSDRIVRTAGLYQQHAIANNKLFAITDSNRVVVWDLNILDTLHFQDNNNTHKYTAIAKDKHDDVFLGEDNGVISKVNQQNFLASRFLVSKYSVEHIFFNSSNKMLLLVPYAIYDPISDRLWRKFRHAPNTNLKRKRKNILSRRYFVNPQIVFIDSRDRIWMANNFGEFGASMQLFDARRRKPLYAHFRNLEMGAIYPQSFFSDETGNLYFSSGLQHFLSSGEIYRVNEDKAVTNIFSSDSIHNKIDEEGLMNSGLFIGPASFNKKDSCVYFSTNEGFYKAHISVAGKLVDHEFLFAPVLRQDREPLAIGMKMSVKSLEFLNDGRMLFRTGRDGFGIYDGKKLVFIK